MGNFVPKFILHIQKKNVTRFIFFISVTALLTGVTFYFPKISTLDKSSKITLKKKLVKG